MSPRRKKPERVGPAAIRLLHPETAEQLEVAPCVPLLPLRDTVLFPGTTIPLFVGRPRSVAGLRAARGGGRVLLAIAQRRPETARPQRQDLFQVGTLARLLQVTAQPDRSCRILVEGLAAARLRALHGGRALTEAAIELLAPSGQEADPAVGVALRAPVADAFREYAALEGGIAPEVLHGIDGDQPAGRLAARIASQLRVRLAVRQRLLETASPEGRLRLLERILASEIERLRARRAPRRRPQPLPDLMPPGPAAAPEPEVGGGESEEVAELRTALEAAHLPPPVAERARRELARLGQLPFASPEAAVVRTYLDWLGQLPWRSRTRARNDLARAEAILEANHYGLSRVKERILEQIAVLKLARRPRGPILCLVGPPGVGKTSLGASVARALGRRFVRLSLGGVRDEAEIRGHRRTYVGSLPGRILQAMRRARVVNPVLLLDELDKLGQDLRGDPAAALLEVLDPEQNAAFSDHYLEVDFDLSRVLFLTTANHLEGIPEPLRDRMEILRLPGYLEGEKLEIARRFLLPRQLRANGLKESDLELSAAVLLRLIREYTREAGVRGLERVIARLCRRVAKLRAGGTEPTLARLARGGHGGPLRLQGRHLDGLLGPALHPAALPVSAGQIGVAWGLAWTETGGEVLTIECGILPGSGELLLTGKLGETMRESAQAALSFVRWRAERLGLQPDFHRRHDIHIHVPEAAVPKDGPSAGVTIALALVSALTGRLPRAATALSGELTLRGRVLAVGGLPEKVVAARRAGVRRLILPEANRVHVRHLPEPMRRGLTVTFAETMEAVLEAGLESGCADLANPDPRGTLPARAA